MGFSPWVLPELSSPLEALVDVVSPAELCSGFPLSPGSKQLMALPLATLPDGCLAVLDPAQLRQPLQPLICCCRAES